MKIDYFKICLIACRVCIGFALIQLGINCFTDPGVRTYNKYLHAVRKSIAPTTKPGDIAFGGMTNDQLNLAMIQVEACVTICAAILIILGRKTFGAICLILVTIFMMVSKDNPRLESNVAAINREKPMRLENFFRDLSMIGAAFMILGGMGGQLLKDVSTGSEKSEEKKE